MSARVAKLKSVLDTFPGAESGPLARFPGVTLYKVMGKMFAILETGKLENVILKCDPHLVDVLRQQYEGVGRRSHLDPRFWISISLDADVPAKEIARLAAGSYDLVRDKLTRKQKAELEALAD
jgi:predicted DNA-binding protein (MmcQ/YjbR family)